MDIRRREIAMRILVIGGSYFYGRVFLMQLPKGHEVTVVNRGTYSMEEFGVTQVTGDRNDKAVFQTLTEAYDVIVDFCAYQPGQVKTVLEGLSGHVTQYILISTVDVYERGSGKRKAEDYPYETRQLPGDAGAYIAGKVALEQELKEECEKRNIAYTIFRPAILFGPYNYAPRESMFIKLMVTQHILVHITDAAGQFQLVYVKDAANAIVASLLREASYYQAYNLCDDGVYDYDALYKLLNEAKEDDAQELCMTAGQAEEQGLPLPFPVRAEETELCTNEKGKQELGITYTDIHEAMGKTYRAFKAVYE